MKLSFHMIFKQTSAEKYYKMCHYIITSGSRTMELVLLEYKNQVFQIMYCNGKRSAKYWIIV